MSVARGKRLSREGISEVDIYDLLEGFFAVPVHMREALWEVESANLKQRDSRAMLVVPVMGGSASCGALGLTAFGDMASRPILAACTYSVAAGATPDTKVLCASYSGGTKGTLAAYDPAGMEVPDGGLTF